MSAAARTAARRLPQQERSRRKVAAILDAAQNLLIAEGPAGFNTNRVAELADVSIGTLYEYFPNKESVALALIDRLSAEETTDLVDRLADVAGSDLGDRIDAVVELTIDLYWRNHELFRALWSLTSVARSVGHRPGERVVADTVRSILEPLVDELAVDDLDLAVFCCFHLVESLAVSFAETRDRWTREQATVEIAAVVKRYLLGAAAPRGPIP